MGRREVFDPLGLENSVENTRSPVDLTDADDGVSDGRVAAILGEQLQEALDDKQKLADELQIERVKNAQLENQVALGNVIFFMTFKYIPG